MKPKPTLLLLTALITAQAAHADSYLDHYIERPRLDQYHERSSPTDQCSNFSCKQEFDLSNYIQNSQSKNRPGIEPPDYLENQYFHSSSNHSQIIAEVSPPPVEEILKANPKTDQEPPDDAEQYYNKALAIDPQNYNALLYLGNLRIRQHHFNDAKDIFIKLICKEPDDPDIQKSLVIALQALYAPIDNPSNLSDSDLHEVAMRLIDIKKYDAAVKFYKEIISRHPDDADHLSALGKLYVRLNSYYDAITLYEQALKLDPANSGILVSLAFAYLFSGDMQQSQETFQKVIEQEHDNADALAGLGFIASQNGNIEEAEKYYEKALKIDPKHYTALIYLGNLRLQQQRYDEANKIFIDLIGREQDDSDVEQGLISALYLRLARESSNAEFSDDQLLLEAKRLTTFANIFFQQDEYAEAEQCLENALKIDPKSQTALIYMGNLRLRQKRYIEAKSIFIQLICKDPNNTAIQQGLLATLQVILASSNELALPIEPTYEPVQTNPNEPVPSATKDTLQPVDQVEVLLIPATPEEIVVPANEIQEDQKTDTLLEKEAKKLSRDNNYRQAAIDYEKLVEKDPHNFNYLLSLGQIYLSLNRNVEALEFLKKAFTLQPSNKDIRLWLAFAYLANKNQDAGKELLQVVLNKDPENPGALAALGRIASLNKNLPLAEKLFQRALRSDPYNIEALAGQGRIFSLKNNEGLAEDYLRKALSIDPNNLTTLEFLALLKMKQKRYGEAYDIYSLLVTRDLNNADYTEGLRLAKNQLPLERPRDDDNYYQLTYPKIRNAYETSMQWEHPRR